MEGRERAEREVRGRKGGRGEYRGGERVGGGVEEGGGGRRNGIALEEQTLADSVCEVLHLLPGEPER
eukprot:669814-Hanusia_phi.AAC.2